MSTQTWDHRAAAKISMERRSARKELRERVHCGELPVAAVIVDNPEILQMNPDARKPITVLEILTWPRWSRAATQRKLLKRLRIGPDVQLHHLSDERRRKLAQAL